MVSLERYRTMGAAEGLALRFPGYQAGGLTFITERTGRRPPVEPETSAMRFAVLDRRDSMISSMLVIGRGGLNEWHEKHVGFRPDDESPTPRPIQALMGAVAEMFYLQQVSDQLTVGEFVNDLHAHVENFSGHYQKMHDEAPGEFPLTQSDDDWMAAFAKYQQVSDIPTYEIDDPEGTSAQIATIPLFLDAITQVKSSLPTGSDAEEAGIDIDLLENLDDALRDLQRVYGQ